MIEVTCVKKNRNSKGNIINYTLRDVNGMERLATGQQIKDAIRNNQLNVINLQIDRAGRLVDKKETKLNKAGCLVDKKYAKLDKSDPYYKHKKLLLDSGEFIKKHGIVKAKTCKGKIEFGDGFSKFIGCEIEEIDRRIVDLILNMLIALYDIWFAYGTDEFMLYAFIVYWNNEREMRCVITTDKDKCKINMKEAGEHPYKVLAFKLPLGGSTRISLNQNDKYEVVNGILQLGD